MLKVSNALGIVEKGVTFASSGLKNKGFRYRFY
jgi:hypothetical protein